MPPRVDVGPPVREGEVTRFTVRVDDHSYDVGVADDDAARLAPGADVADLVRESFVFLLDREPPGSILPRFDLPVIGRYFPEYADAVGRRLRT